MSVVSYIVDTAQGFLNDAAETQFGAVAATVGTVTTVAVTLVLILVCINMVFQYRAMDGRTAFWLGVKIALIGIFAQNWTQFNALSTAILNGIDSIAGSLISAVGGGAPGPSGTYAEQFDIMIADFGSYPIYLILLSIVLRFGQARSHLYRVLPTLLPKLPPGHEKPRKQGHFYFLNLNMFMWRLARKSC